MTYYALVEEGILTGFTAVDSALEVPRGVQITEEQYNQLKADPDAFLGQPWI